MAIGIAKNTPPKPNTAPNTKTANIITTGCSLTASEKATELISTHQGFARLNMPPLKAKIKIKNQTEANLMLQLAVTIKAPKKGIKTENPTKTDKRAIYCKSKYIKIIAAARPTITISMAFPLA